MTLFRQNPDQAADGRPASGLSAIPLRIEGQPAAACDGSGVFALQVLGDSMLPEFESGDIVVVEPEGLLRDGAFVIARSAEGWTLRQLRADPGSPVGWCLAALAPGYPEEAVAGLADIRGVVIQKSKPGRRKTIKHYVG